PRTDDLYDRNLVAPRPEIAKVIDVGWSFSSPTFIASLAAFHTDFENRIERQFDEAAQIFYSVNVGKVKLKGIDGQASWKPEDYVSIYASISYVDSEIQSNFPNGTNG